MIGKPHQAKNTAVLAVMLCSWFPIQSRQITVPAKQAKAPCDSATQLKDLSESAAATITAAIKAAEAATTTATKLRAAALHQSGSAQTALLTLGERSQRRASQLLSQTAASAGTILKGAAAADRLSGAAETLAALQTLTLNDIPRVEAATFTAFATTTLTLQIESQTHGACYKSANERKDSTAAVNVAPAATDELTIPVATPTAGCRTAASPLSICAHSATSGQITSSSDCSTGQTTTIGIKGGNILTITPTATHIQHTTGNAKYKAIGSTQSVPSAKTIERDLALVQAMLNSARHLKAATTTHDWVGDYDETELKTIISKAIGGADATPNKPEIKDTVEAVTAELFGNKGDKITKTLQTFVSGFKPDKAAVGDGSTNLDSISDPDKLSGIAVYYTIKRFIDDQEEKKKNKASPSCPTNAEKPAEPKKNSIRLQKNTQQVKTAKKGVANLMIKKTLNAFQKLKLKRKMKNRFLASYEFKFYS
uniref:Variant surface glycoprotein 1100 n=1 Tax=Trypanosoma brucei TaxID=5691 RepID=M4TAS0_9TRYP|nr:variant surface glycoprotein 1100 [Trypanosoma brucei]